MRKYDIRPGAASESRSKLEAELDWLDNKLADGRTYLAETALAERTLRWPASLRLLRSPRKCRSIVKWKAQTFSLQMLNAGATACDALGYRAVPCSSRAVQQRLHGVSSCAPEVEYFHCF